MATIGPEINGLPPEVFSNIFSNLRKICESSSEGCTNSTIAPWLQWIYVTHVCSQWRKIALRMPNLWADRIPDHPMLATAFLERSKNATLGLIRIPTAVPESYSPFHADARIMAWHELVKPQLHRAREINISLYLHDVPHPSEAYIELLSTLQPLPDMPLLQRLTIAIGENFHGNIPTFSCKLTKSFPHRLSSLRYLELHRCALDWERVEISNLTCLKIKLTPREQRMSMSHLLQLLSRSPRIETLVLFRALQDWSDPNPSQQALEPLTDRLNHIMMADVAVHSRQAPLLLDSIAPLAMSSVTFHIPWFPYLQTDNHFKFVASLQRFIDNSGHAIVSMRIVDLVRYTISFTLGRHVGRTYESIHEFKLKLFNPFSRIDFIRSTFKFLKYISLASLQHLVLSLSQKSYQSSQEHCEQLFRLIPDLKTLAIWKMESARLILQLLTQPLDDNRGKTSSSGLQDHARYLLPQLHEVIFGDKYSPFICDDPEKSESESRLFPRALELFVRARTVAKVVEAQEDISLAGDVVMNYIETPRPFDRLTFFLRHHSDIDTDGERFQRIQELVMMEVNVASVV